METQDDLTWKSQRWLDLEHTNCSEIIELQNQYRLSISEIIFLERRSCSHKYNKLEQIFVPYKIATKYMSSDRDTYMLMYIHKMNSFRRSRTNYMWRLSTVMRRFNVFSDTQCGIINCLKCLAFHGDMSHTKRCLTLMLGFSLIILINVFYCILFVWKLIKANGSQYKKSTYLPLCVAAATFNTITTVKRECFFVFK